MTPGTKVIPEVGQAIEEWLDSTWVDTNKRLEEENEGGYDSEWYEAGIDEVDAVDQGPVVSAEATTTDDLPY